MVLLFVAAGLLALLLWFGWKKPVFALGEWRLGAGLMAIGAFTGAAFIASRGGYVKAAVLFAVSLAFAFLARSRRPQPPAPSASLSRSDALAILGVKAGATRDDIQAAYARLIRRVHPDAGGAEGLAAQLNAARDKLLKG